MRSQPRVSDRGHYSRITPMRLDGRRHSPNVEAGRSLDSRQAATFSAKAGGGEWARRAQTELLLLLPPLPAAPPSTEAGAVASSSGGLSRPPQSVADRTRA